MIYNIQEVVDHTWFNTKLRVAFSDKGREKVPFARLLLDVLVTIWLESTKLAISLEHNITIAMERY